jgi:Zn-dependent peptidase ImmA (M78 family)
VRSVTYSNEELAERVRSLLITVRETIKVNLGPFNFLSQYDPRDTPPAFLQIHQALQPHHRLLVLVHELTHASQHPPGCGDFDEAKYLEEEPSANQAASSICATYGISNYRPELQALGAPSEYFQGGTQPCSKAW